MSDLIIKLVENKIDFNFRCVNEYAFVYVRGFEKDGYTPEIRISLHDDGYYVKNCGVINESCSVDDIFEMIGEMLYFDK